MTDPISDLLTRIRNAASARRESTDAPYSRMKESVVRLLREEGYIETYAVDGEGAKKVLRVKIAYTDSGRATIRGLRRVSRPSMRVYRSAADVPRVRNGLGVSIISTPQGLLIDREARKRNVGGEVVCEVW